MNTSSEHPQRQQLVDFGLGKLGPGQTSVIEEHLDHCDECHETLLNLKDDTFTGLVRSLPEPGTGASPPADALTNGTVADDESSQAVTMPVQSGESIEPSELPAELQDHPRYRIAERIGRGGMGSVYRAQHRLMNRPVALKLINSQLIRHPQAVERFRREVRAAAQLHHPNIVAAYDAEQAGDVHFLAMEFVEGTDLATVVQHRGALPVTEACDCIRQAAQGLQHAHEKGMVHRDIKPHNLMLSPDGQIRILDFGLAGFATESALMEAGSASRTDGAATPLNLTAFGSVMGTPDYIAPEQARDAHAADIRADIYSLGCTLYYLLSGEPPHNADSVAEKLKAHAEREPEAIESVCIDVPDELAEVIRRMMAKDPADRIQSPAEVADALAGFVDRHRTGGPESTLTQSGTSAPMNPLAITFALCFAGTLSILAFVLSVVLFLAAEWVTGIPHWLLSWLQFGGLASLPSGVAALFLADRSERKNSHAAAVRAGLLNLLPLNPFVVILLPLTIWTLLKLKHPSTPQMYEHCPSLDRAESYRRWPLVITTVACLLIAIYAGTFFIIQLGQTTLRFEIDDPTLAVRFKDESISVENDGQTIDIRPGKEQEFIVEQNGAVVETDTLTLRKGDKVVLRVSIIGDGLLVNAEGTRVTRTPLVVSDQIGTTAQDAKSTDAERLQGVWTAESGMSNGRATPTDQIGIQRAVFDGDKLHIEMPHGLKGDGHFQLVESAEPKQIGIFVKGENKESRGIYKLHGDRLTLCTDLNPAAELPTEFNAPAGTTVDVVVLRREATTGDGKTNQELIQGRWQVVSVTDDGEEQPSKERKDRFMTFTGDRFTGPHWRQPIPGKFTLDATSDPKQIDLHFPSGPKSFIHIRGIYRLEGDRMTIFLATDHTASKRPTDFTTAPGDKRSLMVLERVPDRELLQGTWNTMAMEMAGQTAPASEFQGKQFLIEGDRISRFGKLDRLREFRLNPTSSPKQIDIGGSVEGQFSKAIYELEGDTLRLCLSQQTRLDRPKDFDTEGTRYFCFTLKRVEQ